MLSLAHFHPSHRRRPRFSHRCSHWCITAHLLPPTSYLLPTTTYHLLPTSYHLPPTSSYLLPTSYLLHPSTYLPPPTSYLPQPTLYHLPTTTHLLPPTSSLLPATTYLPPPASHPMHELGLRATCFGLRPRFAFVARDPLPDLLQTQESLHTASQTHLPDLPRPSPRPTLQNLLQTQESLHTASQTHPRPPNPGIATEPTSQTSPDLLQT